MLCKPAHSEDIPLSHYVDVERFTKIKEFLADKPTPFLVVDLQRLEQNYNDLKRTMPYATVHYAMKANAHPAVLTRLIELGSSFDIASVAELDVIMSLGAKPEQLTYGNTIKRSSQIAYAYEKGIRHFVTDSEEDLRRIAQYAPKSHVFFRLFMECEGAEWSLSRKFGAYMQEIMRLIEISGELDVIPWGVSFHVGSQQRDINQWDKALEQCRRIFDQAEAVGINLTMLNLGGGLPSRYTFRTKTIDEYAEAITDSLKTHFPEGIPTILTEPGRSLVGDCGILATEVILDTYKDADQRWIYIDAGKFRGIYETIDESIKYPIYCDKSGTTERAILAGPTCDSMDVLYESVQYQFPDNLEEGDRLYFLSAGAYIYGCSLQAFNGFLPPEVYIYDDR